MTGTLNLTVDAAGNAVLSLVTKDKNEARATFNKLKDCPVSAEFKKYYKKRSTRANAYAWVLITKIAQATGLTNTQIYKGAIMDLGGNMYTVTIPFNDLDGLVEDWRAKGLGWIAEPFPSETDGYIDVLLYRGSSNFDTLQMTRFISNLVQDCDSLGIEHLTPEELNRMLGDWNEEYIKRKSKSLPNTTQSKIRSI